MANRSSRICPLRCGQCCDDYWREVVYSDGLTCPHNGLRGCTLPRRVRPDDCVRYLCGVAAAVRDGRISRRTGMQLKEQCCEDIHG